MEKSANTFNILTLSFLLQLIFKK